MQKDKKYIRGGEEEWVEKEEKGNIQLAETENVVVMEDKMKGE